MTKVSIIVPCFNEEESIPLFYQEATGVLKATGKTYEILFVDDGSTDKTPEIIRELAGKDEHILYLSFSKNFGKEAAMLAGLENCHGEYVAMMDADLQDPPSLLPEMIECLESHEYDCVATRRANRTGEPKIRSWCAKKFYKIVNRFSDAEIVDGARDFRLMNRDMVNAILSMNEYSRFSKGIFGWVGFRTKWLSFDNAERVAGKSKWCFWKLFQYALDGIIGFSEAPLHLASWIGSGMTLFSFLAMLVIAIRKLFLNGTAAGWALAICVIVFMGGIQLIALGIIGQYLAKTYWETKRRPHYIAADSNIDDVKKIG